MSELTVEKTIERLEEINRALSSGEASVNDAVKLYKEAAELIKACEAMINAAREELEKTAKSLGGEE